MTLTSFCGSGFGIQFACSNLTCAVAGQGLHPPDCGGQIGQPLQGLKVCVREGIGLDRVDQEHPEHLPAVPDRYADKGAVGMGAVAVGLEEPVPAGVPAVVRLAGPEYPARNGIRPKPQCSPGLGGVVQGPGQPQPPLTVGILREENGRTVIPGRSDHLGRSGQNGVVQGGDPGGQGLRGVRERGQQVGQLGVQGLEKGHHRCQGRHFTLQLGNDPSVLAEPAKPEQPAQ